MTLTIPVVIKNQNEWIAGRLDKGKLKDEFIIKTLKSVENADKYMDMVKYLTHRGFSKEEADKMKASTLKRLNAESIYVYDAPLQMEPKDFKHHFWSDYNTLCQKCQRECKQSSKITLVQCPIYEKVVQ